ncbi:small-conductance mechanosensitive channel [Parvibaculum indicum]|uniref:mechanosensitive ion channel family protein n=1 Tax=Parvibaculum indicum TaxID=562969 RepID=UPI00141F07E9|nr:mechanosensitive ion channel domain-containing protein [Parvibaculum indicum]NIJ41822.1 small-conductance mechanosensitive channel [Parvibaculum indicum]
MAEGEQAAVLSDSVQDFASSAVRMLETLWNRIEASLFNWHALVELAIIFAIAVAAIETGKRVAPKLRSAIGTASLPRWVIRTLEHQIPLVAALSALILLWVAAAALTAAGETSELLGLATSLLVAWVVIRFVGAFIGSAVVSALFSTIVWIIAALAILGWLQPVMHALDAAAIRAGSLRISVLMLLTGAALFVALLWAANLLSKLLESQLAHVEGITPAAQVLVGKILRIALITVAVLVALTSVGIDFTALAVFSGAVGVGIGFGLQKVVSNLISGIILLLDRSIKPGDVIEVGDAYGWIRKLGARYAAIVTRDGKEYLIPNEDLITQQVVNWSYSDRNVRMHIPIGISYHADVRLAMKLIEEAALACPRVLRLPSPVVRLVGFGDSSVDLELRFWVDDPEEGTVNIRSDVLLQVWDRFHENGIEIPFPQRDIHIVSAEGLKGTSGTD